MASSSVLPSPRRQRAQSRRRGSGQAARGTGGTDCWCGGRGSRAGALVTLGTVASALAAVPLASASPVVARQTDALSFTPQSLPPDAPTAPTPSYSLLSLTTLAPTPPPSQSSSAIALPPPRSIPQIGKRRIARFEEINRWWLDGSAWSLNGRSGGLLPTASSASANDDDDDDDKADKNFGVIVSTTHDAYSSATVLADNTAAATGSSISLPRGWEPRSRPTSFYAIPVIIAMSLIVSVMLIGVIVGTVIWRRKARTGNAGGRAGDAEKGKGRRKKKGAAAKESAIDGMVNKIAGKMGKGRKKGQTGSDAGGGSVSGSVAGRAAGVEDRSVSRLRQRRARRQSSGTAADRVDDEAAPLTRTASSLADAPHNTLTARLATRLRASVARTPPSPAPNPSVVFSRDVRRTRTQSTASSPAPSRRSSLALSRTSSLASVNSRRTLPEIEEPSTLGQPADPPLTLPAPLASPTPSSSTEFGLLFPSTLPVLGPPAYRPNSSTIQSTSRLTQSILPLPAVVVVAPEEAEENIPASDDENATHWPNEKPQRRPRPSTSSIPSPPSSPPPPPPPSAPDDEPPIDRSTFAAHLATDDKTVLARLRAAAASTSSSASALASASAPPLEEADVDEDGFERFVPDLEEPAPSEEPSFGLPEPPRAVETSFEYGSPRVVGTFAREGEEADDGPVPGYRPRGEVMALASAPPAEWEEESEEELEYLEERGTVRMEHGIV